MKSKLVYSGYDDETGISTAIIRNKYGTFSGVSTLQPEDEIYKSSFAGCRYAELKAEIKYMKERIKILKYQISALRDCYWRISQGKDFNSNSYEAKKFRKQIKILEKEKKEWENKINSLKNNIITDSENRIKVIKTIQKNHKDKNI